MAAFETPDYHFLMIAPNLGTEWLFTSARTYWERYRPTIISDYTFLQLIPLGYTLAVTVIARRDSAEAMRVQLATLVPRAWFDPIIYDYAEDAQLALEGRAAVNQPLGVPYVPSATPLPPAATLGPSPTWTEIPTRPPAGYITHTPAPIQPTPGPLPNTGG
jgi:hypothetical protein